MICRPSPKFRIKICGVQSLDDIQAVASAGADAVGFNFYPKSIRYLEPSFAVDICHAAREAKLVRVGLFVDPSPDALQHFLSLLSFDLIQLHGNESPEAVIALQTQGIPVMKAIRLPLGTLTLEGVERSLHPWRDFVDQGGTLLFDADSGRQMGGAGESIDWTTLGLWQRRNQEVAWVLAGGLTPSNVIEAIELTGAKSVDVASGVESPRGRKSAESIRLFTTNALRGLEGLA